MRTKRTTFRVGQMMCGLSLSAWLGLPYLCRPSPASAAPKERAPAEASVYDEHLAMLEAIWESAWDLAFVPYESSMVMTNLDDGAWLVLVCDAGAEDTPFVDQGFFIETDPREHVPEFAWNEDHLAASGLLSVQYSLATGVLYGSTGWEHQIDALVADVYAPGENPGADPVFVQILAPVDVLTVPVDERAQPPRPIGPPGSAPPGNAHLTEIAHSHEDGLEVDCEAIWQVCKDACWDEYIGESAACGFAAAACVGACLVGCAATTFAYGVCVAICSGACEKRCDIDRMECEPGWHPEAAE
jgi:hypothetical protein